MKTEIRITDDGSTTLYVPGLGDHYHSTFGALTESQHVFIKNGLLYLSEKGMKELKIMEAGFGTGLNALLTLDVCLSSGLKVHYHGFDLYPVGKDVMAKLNYPELLGNPDLAVCFDRIHASAWDKKVEITGGFHLEKKLADWREYNLPKGFFDLVFYDAFGPEAQPGMWKEDTLNRVGESVTPGGVFVTYSARGEVRRNLKSAGFDVEKLPGPPGKRHVIRATKT